MRLSRFALSTYRRDELPPLEPDTIIEIGRPVRRRRDWHSQAVGYPAARACPNCGTMTWGQSDSCRTHAERAADDLGREVPCDEYGHWHSTAAAKRAHGVFACTACHGDGCAACDGSGFRAYFLGDERDQPLDLWWIDNALPGQPPRFAAVVRFRRRTGAPQG